MIGPKEVFEDAVVAPVKPVIRKATPKDLKQIEKNKEREEKAFEISRDDDATWVLSGEKLMKLFNMTNFDRDESVMKFARQLRGMGVDEALRCAWC